MQPFRNIGSFLASPNVLFANLFLGAITSKDAVIFLLPCFRDW
jgi:hypothetical protein